MITLKEKKPNRNHSRPPAALTINGYSRGMNEPSFISLSKDQQIHSTADAKPCICFVMSFI